MRLYRKKPVIVEAEQWDGSPESAAHIKAWVLENGTDCGYLHYHPKIISLRSSDGVVYVHPGDFVIHDVHGGFYALKPGYFSGSYEELLPHID